MNHDNFSIGSGTSKNRLTGCDSFWPKGTQVIAAKLFSSRLTAESLNVSSVRPLGGNEPDDSYSEKRINEDRHRPRALTARLCVHRVTLLWVR